MWVVRRHALFVPAAADDSLRVQSVHCRHYALIVALSTIDLPVTIWGVVEQFVSGLVLAAAVGLPPGIVMAETIRRGIRGGFRAAFAVQVGSLLGDLVYAVLGLTGAAIALTAGWLQIVIGLAGVGLMVALGVAGMRDALRPRAAATTAPPCIEGAMAVGATLSLTNPWVIVFWLGFGAAAGGIAPATGLDGLAVVLTGYVIGLTVLAVALSAAIAVTRGRLGTDSLRVVGAAASLSILALAALFAVRLLEIARA